MTTLTRRTIATAFVFSMLSAASTASGQLTVAPSPTLRVRASYTISGSSAWNTARQNNFVFRPLAFSTGQSVSSPTDGVNTQLRDASGVIAAVQNGVPIVYPPKSGSRTVEFAYFAARPLAKDWSVVGVQLNGAYTWTKAPATGSSDLQFRFRVTAYAGKPAPSVSITSITLQGWSGQSSSAAFTGSP